MGIVRIIITRKSQPLFNCNYVRFSSSLVSLLSYTYTNTNTSYTYTDIHIKLYDRYTNKIWISSSIFDLVRLSPSSINIIEISYFKINNKMTKIPSWDPILLRVDILTSQFLFSRTNQIFNSICNWKRNTIYRIIITISFDLNYFVIITYVISLNSHNYTLLNFKFHIKHFIWLPKFIWNTRINQLYYIIECLVNWSIMFLDYCITYFIGRI